MKKILFLSIIASFAIGCDVKFGGQLGLHETMKFTNLTKREQKTKQRCISKDWKGRTCKRLQKVIDKTTVVLEPMNYSANVIPGKKTFKIKIKKPGSRKVIQTLTIGFPKDKKPPSYSGEFAYKAAELSVNYDVNGSIETQETNSEPTRSVESCSFTEYFEVCGYKKRDDGTEYHTCWTESRTYYGQQNVEYYYHYTDKGLELKIVKPDSNMLVANYSGTYHDSDKIYTYKGYCH